MRYAYSQYSDLASGHCCMHAHMADVCAACNGDVMHSMGKTKRLRIFRDSAADTHERATARTFISRVGYSPGRCNSS